MDILFLNWKDIKNPEMGGAEIIILELGKRLVRDGHTVTWFTRKFSGAEEKEQIEGIKIVRRGGRLTVYIYAFLYYMELIKKPDKVIDCINTICWFTPLYVPKKSRIMLLNQLAKEVFFYSKEIPKFLGLLGYIFERLMYAVYRDTKVLCYSKSTASDAISFGIPEKNISIFPIGLDLARYTSGVKSKYPLFIFVARFNPMKRGDLCIRAMKTVIGAFPTARLALIGYGHEEASYRRIIDEYGISTSVEIVNKNNVFFSKSKIDLKTVYMKKAWALLLPSVKEGWGMVVTEAAASKTPAIVTDVSGLRDSVIHNKTGIIVSSNPSEFELARAMIHLIKETALRSRLSDQAYSFGRTFSWNKSYTSFLRNIC